MARSRGQSLVELVTLVAVLAAGIIGAQTYLKRGLQAKVRTHTIDLLRVSDDDLTGLETQRRGASEEQAPIQLQDFVDACAEAPGCPPIELAEDEVSSFTSDMRTDQRVVDNRAGGGVNRTQTMDQVMHRQGQQLSSDLLGAPRTTTTTPPSSGGTP